MVHGRNSYKRSAALGQFVMHRGMIISTMQVRLCLVKMSFMSHFSIQLILSHIFIILFCSKAVYSEIVFFHRPSFHLFSTLHPFLCTKASSWLGTSAMMVSHDLFFWYLSHLSCMYVVLMFAYIYSYATIYTMFPVFSLVLDQDVKPDMALLYPELYKDLTKVMQQSMFNHLQNSTVSTYSVFIFQIGNVLPFSLLDVCVNDLYSLLFFRDAPCHSKPFSFGS